MSDPDEEAAEPGHGAGASSDQAPGEDADPDAASETGDDAPLAGLREAVEGRRTDREEVPAVEDVFEEANDEPVVDGEAVWSDLLASDEPEAGTVAFGESVSGAGEAVTVVPDSVCHTCPYFGDPPELHCEHEGTTIRRLVDMMRFEVVDCPVVERRSELQNQ